MSTPANPDDLTAWLRATLDAREQEIRERHHRTCGHDNVGPDWPCNCDDHVSFSLAEVDAKRRILAFHEGEHDCPEVVTGVYPDDWPTGVSWGNPGERWSHMRVEHFEADEPCPTQRLLALPFADREGFREEWRPA